MQTSMEISAAVALQQRFSDCVPFGGDDNWADHEIAGCEFKDARLGRRYAKLLKRMGSAMGESIPLVCQDWANTKAAYRFTPVNGSAKPISWAAIFNRRVIVLRQAAGQF